MIDVDSDEFPYWPIVGPEDSIVRFLRGETVWPEDIEADQSRSDVWPVTKDQYRRWRIIHPDKTLHPPLS